MPPTVILIRHAEALHNVNNKFAHPPLLTSLAQLPNSSLTAANAQSTRLREHLREEQPLAEKVEMIVASPMVRTLQTALVGLSWLIEKGVKVELDPMWQECSDKPCDTGSPVSQLANRFPQLSFDTVDHAYPAKPRDSIYGFTSRAVVARGQACLKSLYQRKEKVVAVVSHSGFLRTAVSHTKYANADYRIFDFSPDSSLKDPELVEWGSTAANGGGMGKSEKGRAEIVEGDFPPEELKEVGEQMGIKTSREPANEVPSS
ncbi:hypothetical protein B0A49_00411 [Cryomyces minteri]|uniref:Phosphoglycerate mutase-like protein n=1 Tax=Cryomyces minteri TaxID=331657 RepID=A0A4U0Y0H7_9PEZI|nr:hypothetical protein B0A49_00411 [Cryomyces minteri]